MKKLFSLALAVLMIASLSTSALAATNTGAAPTSIEVKAKYSGGVTTSEKISVDVEWGAMEFTYSVGGTRTWNPANHSYTDGSTASWTASGNTVIVTNHSNVAVTAGFAFTPKAESSVTGRFNVASKTLAAGVVGGYSSADKVISTLTLSGSVPATQTTFAQVGTINVTIAKAS